MLDQFNNVRQHLEADLQKIERILADTEHNYLTADYSQVGTILKGFDGFLSSKEMLRKRTRTFKPEDRLFSLASKTSPVTRELDQPMLEEQPSGQPYKKQSFAQKGYGRDRRTDR